MGTYLVSLAHDTAPQPHTASKKDALLIFHGLRILLVTYSVSFDPQDNFMW